MIKIDNGFDDNELEERARRAVTRAIDAVAVAVDQAGRPLADGSAGSRAGARPSRAPWAVAGVGAIAAAAVAAVVLVPGSGDGESVVAGTDGTATTVAAQEPPDASSTPAASTAVTGTSTDDDLYPTCDAAAPPFTIGQLPPGIEPTVLSYYDWRASVTPPGYEQAPELYDPTFVLLDPNDDERRMEIYNGNSWRLQSAIRDEELTVFGAPAWISDVGDGTVIIDFSVPDSPNGCAGWSIGGAGITEADVRAAVASLTLD